MITVTEGSFINSDIVTVQMEIPKDEWEKIRLSEEWQRLLNSDAGNENRRNETQKRKESEVRRMWTVVFAITTFVCGLGWLTQHISVLALVYYLTKKGYAQPTDSELKECTSWAAKKFFRR